MPKGDSRRIQTRRSGVHGKGVFALQDIGEGETIIEYVGEIITWAEAQARHPHDPKDPNHTFYFHIDEKHVIDAKVGGNSSRWINHSCDGNCEADEVDGRVFIKALRDIAPGEELFYDYGLMLDERGEQLTTRALSERLSLWSREAPCATFLIGSADGLDAALKSGAHAQIGLSRLTLPHGLARIFLIEQLYRAVTLLSGHPYHRD